MSERLTNRGHLTYLFGAFLVAAVLSVGVGLMAGIRWRPVLGATMVLTVLFYALTVTREAAERKP